MSQPYEAACAEDDAPDFDIAPDFSKLKSSLTQEHSLTWQGAIGKTALVGLSRQLHALLRSHDPEAIGSHPGPYNHAIIVKIFSNYIAHHRHEITDPNRKGVIFPSNIPEFRLLMGKDQLLFSELADPLRRHLVLLDIID